MAERLAGQVKIALAEPVKVYPPVIVAPEVCIDSCSTLERRANDVAANTMATEDSYRRVVVCIAASRFMCNAQSLCTGSYEAGMGGPHGSPGVFREGKYSRMTNGQVEDLALEAGAIAMAYPDYVGRRRATR